ncbi:uncharacterized protein LOC134140637 isoform X3 [Rhea pennata]|uniref:uncharacterized protein LOC134140637 isoform X3 n=1 Tax=Rhea pennata TaxID=8795 RepID=UPI002E26E51A
MACSSGHCGCEKSQVVPVGWIATAGNGYMLCAESAFGRSSCQAWSRTMELLPHTACWDRNVGCNTEISCGPSKKWLRIPGEAEQVPLTSLQRSCGSLESAWHRCGTMCSEGPSHLAGAWCVARLGTATRRLAVRMGKRSSLFSGFAGSCGEENVSGNKKAEQMRSNAEARLLTPRQNTARFCRKLWKEVECWQEPEQVPCRPFRGTPADRREAARCLASRGWRALSGCWRQTR